MSSTDPSLAAVYIPYSEASNPKRRGTAKLRHIAEQQAFTNETESELEDAFLEPPARPGAPEVRVAGGPSDVQAAQRSSARQRSPGAARPSVQTG